VAVHSRDSNFEVSAHPLPASVAAPPFQTVAGVHRRRHARGVAASSDRFARVRMTNKTTEHRRHHRVMRACIQITSDVSYESEKTLSDSYENFHICTNSMMKFDCTKTTKKTVNDDANRHKTNAKNMKKNSSHFDTGTNERTSHRWCHRLEHRRKENDERRRTTNGRKLDEDDGCLFGTPSSPLSGRSRRRPRVGNNTRGDVGRLELNRIVRGE
jgi:hypothetical protein